MVTSTRDKREAHETAKDVCAILYFYMPCFFTNVWHYMTVCWSWKWCAGRVLCCVFFKVLVLGQICWRIPPAPLREVGILDECTDQKANVIVLSLSTIWLCFVSHTGAVEGTAVLKSGTHPWKSSRVKILYRSSVPSGKRKLTRMRVLTVLFLLYIRYLLKRSE